MDKIKFGKRRQKKDIRQTLRTRADSDSPGRRSVPCCEKLLVKPTAVISEYFLEKMTKKAYENA